MAQESGETKEQEHSNLEDWLEFVPSILMAVAVLLTAYSAYEATRWSGVQATSFAKASSLRADATAATSVGITQLSYDAGTFGEIAIELRGADLSDPEERESALRLANALFRDEFKPYFKEWIALEPTSNPGAPGTPFDPPNFRNVKIAEAERLAEEAEAEFDAAKEANETGDNYIMATIFFAAVLFFTGLKIRNVKVRGIVIGLATVGLAGGIIRISTLPFQ